MKDNDYLCVKRIECLIQEVITIAEKKEKPKYIFENSNNPKEVEKILKKIV